MWIKWSVYSKLEVVDHPGRKLNWSLLSKKLAIKRDNNLVLINDCNILPVTDMKLIGL